MRSSCRAPFRRRSSAVAAAIVVVCVVAAAASAQARERVGAGGQSGAARPQSETRTTPAAVTTVRTSHLTVQAAASAESVAPGTPFSLSIEVTPRRGMHVYAPGKHDYQVIRFTPDSRPWLRADEMKYPPSELYHFVPLDEKVETYLKPFTLEQPLRVLDTAEARKALADQKAVTVSGTLEYQACDDRICYAPAKVPLTFTLSLTSGN